MRLPDAQLATVESSEHFNGEICASVNNGLERWLIPHKLLLHAPDAATPPQQLPASAVHSKPTADRAPNKKERRRASQPAARQQQRQQRTPRTPPHHQKHDRRPQRHIRPPAPTTSHAHQPQRTASRPM